MCRSDVIRNTAAATEIFTRVRITEVCNSQLVYDSR